MSDLIRREDAREAIEKLMEIHFDRQVVLAKARDAIVSLPSAEAEDRHYIKIYADDEPSVKAEKLYQICGETENREVSGWLKEYFPSDEDYDYERAVDQMNHDVVYEPTYNPEDGSI